MRSCSLKAREIKEYVQKRVLDCDWFFYKYTEDFSFIYNGAMFLPSLAINEKNQCENGPSAVFMGVV